MNNLSCVEFAAILKEELYFEDSESVLYFISFTDNVRFFFYAFLWNLNEVENPDFQPEIYKKGQCFTKMIQNGHSQFLVLEKASDQIQLNFHSLTRQDYEKSNCKFKIQSLLNDNPDSLVGYPVVLQVDFEDKIWTLCCSDDGGVKAVDAKPEDVPDTIGSNKHKAVFFLRQMTGQAYKYRVESSWWENMFLSFEHEQPSLVRLVLKAHNEDDETQSLQIENSCNA